MALKMKDFVPGNESFMPTFEDDATSVSIEQVIDVETATAEEDAEVEEVTEEVTEADAEADTAEEAAEMYSRFEYLIDTIEQVGLSRPMAMALNFDNDLYTIAPGLPSMESLSMTASPNDAASVIAVEGFKETMKSFWKWVKNIARKVRDTIVNLASRVAGLFTRLDSTAKRLAKAIAAADINEKKLNDRKAKLMSYSTWSEFAKVLANSETGLNEVTTAAQNAANGKPITIGGNMQNIANKLGININVGENKVETSDSSKDNFKTEEKVVGGGGHGWTKAICSDTSQVAKIYGISRALPGVTSKVKAISASMEAMAARAEKMTEGGDANQAKASRASAKEAVKMMNLLQRAITKISAAGFQLVREFIKAQRQVYACRGNYDAPDTK